MLLKDTPVFFRNLRQQFVGKVFRPFSVLKDDCTFGALHRCVPGERLFVKVHNNVVRRFPALKLGDAPFEVSDEDVLASVSDVHVACVRVLVNAQHPAALRSRAGTWT